MKLTILGGGGVRIPLFVRSLVSNRPDMFSEISLFEPDGWRRETTGRLAAEVAGLLGHPRLVSLTADAEEAFTGASFIFSAIRVGGDRGRVIDEEIALRRGLVGQETTGPGGAAMALRTIPVVLAYCRQIAQCAPGAVLINFTNPAGLITQAISLHSAVPVVGVCDTPSGMAAQLAKFLEARPEEVSYGYSGLNHLGWVTSFRTGGAERLGELLDRYGELQEFDHRFAALDREVVQRLGALPSEYVFYYYDPQRYVNGVASAGSTRGQDVARLNEELLGGVARAFEKGQAEDAWSTYSLLMGVRNDTYMRTDTEGASGQEEARSRRSVAGAAPLEGGGTEGYEGIALQVISGLGGRPSRVTVNTPNGRCLPFLEPDDVVEVPALVHNGGIEPLATGELPRSAKSLVGQVKEYERTLVEAAVTGDARLAEVALSLHPLVPGITAARELSDEYRQAHGSHLAYLR